MATIETATVPRSTPSVPRQVLRGIGRTAAGLATLLLLTMVLKNPGSGDGITNTDVDTGHTTVDIEPQWKAMFVIAVVAATSFFVFRRLRRWPERPRWLVPMSVGVLVAGCGLLLWPTGVTDSYNNTHTCNALLDAWHPVVANPGAADMAVLFAYYQLTPKRSPYTDPAKTRAFYAAQRLSLERQARALQSQPGYARAERYSKWSVTQNSCAPKARTFFAEAGAVFVGGAAVLAGATAYTRRRARAAVGA